MFNFPVFEDMDITDIEFYHILTNNERAIPLGKLFL